MFFTSFSLPLRIQCIFVDRTVLLDVLWYFFFLFCLGTYHNKKMPMQFQCQQEWNRMWNTQTHIHSYISIIGQIAVEYWSVQSKKRKTFCYFTYLENHCRFCPSTFFVCSNNSKRFFSRRDRTTFCFRVCRECKQHQRNNQSSSSNPVILQTKKKRELNRDNFAIFLKIINYI